MSAELNEKAAFKAPALSCDSHFHVFGKAEQYPYSADLRYKPPLAPLEDYLALAGHLGIERYVFVQPSAYGRDNACMLDAMREMGITHIVRGQKDCDHRKAPISDGDVIDGVTYLLPLQHWTDADVLAFLAEQGVELPAHYAYGASSMDCWDCTAYLYEPQRFNYLRAKHPERFAVVRERLNEIGDTLRQSLNIIEAVNCDGI